MEQIYNSLVCLFKIGPKISKNAVNKTSKWLKDTPSWSGRLVLMYNQTIRQCRLNFENDEREVYMYVVVDEYPCQKIKSVPGQENLFVVKNDSDHAGTSAHYGLSFYQTMDGVDFIALLTQYLRKIETTDNNKQTKCVGDKDKRPTSINDNKCKTILKFLESYHASLADNNYFINSFSDIDERFRTLVDFTQKTIDGLKHNDKNNLIMNKFRTPMEQRTRQFINRDNIENNVKKKRDANAAEINADEVHHQSDAVTKNGKKSQTTSHTDDDDKENSNNTSVVTKKPNRVAKKTQPHKKLRLSEDDLDVIMLVESPEKAKPPSRMAKSKAKTKLKNKTKKTSRASSSTTTTANTTTVSQATTATPPKQPNNKSQKPVQMEYQTPKQNAFKYEAILNTNTKTIKAADDRRPPPTPATTGKVKQMVNLVEQKIREINHPAAAAVAPTPGKLLRTVEKQPPPRVLRAHTRQQQQQQQASLRSSIDKRKLRTSQAKLEAKRQSIKQVKALVNTVQQEASATRPKPHINETIATLDTTTTTSNTDSDKAERNLPRDFLSSSHIRDNYKVVNVKGISGVPMSAQRKQSISKFYERNTPSKLTRTEQEERLRAELVNKEVKDKERLNRLEKEQQEKIENQKKKREDRMRVIQEQKLKQKEEDEKRREEMERKERLVEENKQRLIEEKKREEAEKLKQREQRLAEEKRKHEEYIKQQQLVVKPPVVPAKPHTAVATPGKYADHHHTAFGTMASNKINDKPKPIAQILPNKQIQSSSKNLETTYVLNTPAPALVQSKIQKSNVSLAQQVLNSSLYNQCTASSAIQSYACTPLQAPKLKDQNNYDVSDLRSDDETDDEEEPSKPVPDWAKDQNVKRKAMNQYVNCINYTKIFKTSTNYEIKLEEIFRTRRKKFTERSSSAIWNSPPIWKTGINGEDSFRKLYPS